MNIEIEYESAEKITREMLIETYGSLMQQIEYIVDSYYKTGTLKPYQLEDLNDSYYNAKATKSLIKYFSAPSQYDEFITSYGDIKDEFLD